MSLCHNEVGLNLIGTVGMFISILNFDLYQLFDLEYPEFTFSLGSGILIVIINLLLLAWFVLIIFRWINGSLFKTKTTKKWLEFLQIWLISTLFIELCIIVTRFMPSFGHTISIPHLTITVLAGVVYIASVFINRKYRLT